MRSGASVCPCVDAHLGLAPVRRSTLADANRVRPVALFEDVMEALVAQLGGNDDVYGLCAGKELAAIQVGSERREQ